MRWFYKTKGVISVFLIIIMLPIMTLAAVLIDGARLRSAKMIVQEASDVSAMSAVTNYNTVLKDNFGLFALKDPEKSKKIYEECLKNSLNATSIHDGDTYADKTYALLQNAVFPSDYYNADFLNLYDFTVDNVNVQELYSLANKEVLENQIVEYAKYRGVYTALERMDLLSRFSDLEKEMKESQDGISLMKDKKSTDKAAQKAESAILKLVNKVKSYNDKYKDLNDVCFAKYKEELKKYMEDLSEDKSASAEDLKKTEEDLKERCVSLKKELNDIKKYIDAAISGTDEYITKLNSFKSNSLSGKDSEVASTMSEETDNDIATYTNYKKEVEKLKKEVEKKDYKSIIEEIEKLPAKIGEAVEWNILNGDDETSGGETSDGEETEEVETSYKFKDVKKEGQKYDDVKETEDTETAATWYNGYLDKEYKKLTGFTFNNPMGSGNEEAKDKLKNQSNSVNDKLKGDSSDSVKLEKEVFNALPSRSFKGDDNAGEVTNSDDEEYKAPTYSFDSEKSSEKDDFDNVTDNMLSTLGSFLESRRDDIIVFSYLFGDFNTRMTNKEYNKRDDLTDAENDYILPGWRVEGEKNLRGNLKRENKNHIFNNEIEYVYFGSKSDNSNKNAVYATIFATRMANNLIAAYLTKSVRNECKAAGVAASSATLGAVPAVVFEWIFLAAFASMETLTEMDYLVNYGYKIPLIKKKGDLIYESIWDVVTPSVNKLVELNKKSVINVTYEDYLILLLAIVPGEKRIMRIGDLIQLNMGKLGQSDFKMSEAFTYIKADSEISIRYMFKPIKQFSETYSGVADRVKFTNTVYQGY